jgi:hypothetical protein
MVAEEAFVVKLVSIELGSLIALARIILGVFWLWTFFVPLLSTTVTLVLSALFRWILAYGLPALGVQMCATSVALPLTERGNGAAEHATRVLHRREPRHRGGGFVAENKTKNIS